MDTLGDGYRIVGTTDDGGVEAMEHLERRIVAVQWHPEMQDTADTDPVFRWLTESAS